MSTFKHTLAWRSLACLAALGALAGCSHFEGYKRPLLTRPAVMPAPVYEAEPAGLWAIRPSTPAAAPAPAGLGTGTTGSAGTGGGAGAGAGGGGGGGATSVLPAAAPAPLAPAHSAAPVTDADVPRARLMILPARDARVAPARAAVAASGAAAAQAVRPAAVAARPAAPKPASAPATVPTLPRVSARVAAAPAAAAASGAPRGSVRAHRAAPPELEFEEPPPIRLARPAATRTR